MSILRFGQGLALVSLLGLPQSATMAADPVTFDAFATWSLSGVAVASAPEEMTLVGSMQGPLFVEAGQGPVLAGTVVCPGTLTVSLADGSQRGEGVCAFTAKDGAEAYGRWACTGFHLVGCQGTFTFTGGSGRLDGVAGSSALLIRGELLELAQAAGSHTGERVLGIILWRDLQASLPGTE